MFSVLENSGEDITYYDCSVERISSSIPPERRSIKMDECETMSYFSFSYSTSMAASRKKIA